MNAREEEEHEEEEDGKNVGTAFEHKRKGKCQDPDQEGRGRKREVSKKEGIRKASDSTSKQSDSQSGGNKNYTRSAWKAEQISGRKVKRQTGMPANE